MRTNFLNIARTMKETRTTKARSDCNFFAYCVPCIVSRTNPQSEQKDFPRVFIILVFFLFARSKSVAPSPRALRVDSVSEIFVCYMLILSINYSYCQHNNSSDVNSDEQYTIRGEWQDTILYVARRSLIVVYVFLFFYCRRSFVMRNVATMLSYRIPAPSLKICTDKTGVSSLTFYV